MPSQFLACVWHLCCRIQNLAIPFLICYGTAFAGGDGGWEAARQDLGRKINLVLVEAGLCASASLCSREEILFYRAQRQSIIVTLYIPDNDGVLPKIVAECAAVAIQHKVPVMEVEVLRARFKEVQSGLKKARIGLKFNLTTGG